MESTLIYRTNRTKKEITSTEGRVALERLQLHDGKLLLFIITFYLSDLMLMYILMLSRKNTTDTMFNHLN